MIHLDRELHKLLSVIDSSGKIGIALIVSSGSRTLVATVTNDPVAILDVIGSGATASEAINVARAKYTR